MIKVDNNLITNYIKKFLKENNLFSSLIEIEKELIKKDDWIDKSVLNLIINSDYFDLIEIYKYDKEEILFEIYKQFLLEWLSNKNNQDEIVNLLKICKEKLNKNYINIFINFMNKGIVQNIEGYENWTVNKGKYELIIYLNNNNENIFNSNDLWEYLNDSLKNKYITNIKENLKDINIYYDENSKSNIISNSNNNIYEYNINKFVEFSNIDDKLPVRSVSFSLNGKYFAIGNNNKSIKIGNINSIIEENSNVIYEFKNIHNGPIYTLDWSDNDKLLASGSMDKTIKINNLEENEDGNILLKTNDSLKGHNGVIRSITFFENKLISGGLDDKILVWDINKSEIIQNYNGNISQIYNLQIHTEKNLLGCVGGDNEIQIWDLRHNKKSISINTNDYSLINFWNFFNNKKAKKFNTINKTNNKINYNFFTSHKDGIILEWDLRNNKEPFKKIEIHNDDCRSIEISPCSNYLLTSSFDKTCKIYDLKNDKIIQTLDHHNDRVVSAIWHPLQPIILTSSADCKASIWISNHNEDSIN